MTLETIKVGVTTMYAETVPVNVLFEELYDSPSFAGDILADRFQLLEIDGYYLVIHEIICDNEQATQKFKAFICKKDALSYLEMHGIDPGDVCLE